MINKNLIRIITLNECAGNIIIFGEFSHNEIQKMINISKEHNMSCLSFIEIYDYTFFNEKQCATIKNELKILDTYENLNKNLLQTLFAAAETSIKSHSYIKIEGDKGELA